MSLAPSRSIGTVAKASILGRGSPHGALSVLGVVIGLSHALGGGSPICGNCHANSRNCSSSIISVNSLKNGCICSGRRSVITSFVSL